MKNKFFKLAQIENYLSYVLFDLGSQNEIRIVVDLDSLECRVMTSVLRTGIVCNKKMTIDEVEMMISKYCISTGLKFDGLVYGDFLTERTTPEYKDIEQLTENKITISDSEVFKLYLYLFSVVSKRPKNTIAIISYDEYTEEVKFNLIDKEKDSFDDALTKSCDDLISILDNDLRLLDEDNPDDEIVVVYAREAIREDKDIDEEYRKDLLDLVDEIENKVKEEANGK